MPTEERTQSYFKNDRLFDSIYPETLRRLSGRHWTPMHIAERSAAFLAQPPGAKILDVGSGAGKFCLIAGHAQPDCTFQGIEQRKYLTDQAEIARTKTGLGNVAFLNRNFTEVDFSPYQGIYFYNSFFEHIDNADRIDDDVECSEALYLFYVTRLHDKLRLMPEGTRLVTYHSLLEEVPLGYHVMEQHERGNLIFWIKR